MTTFLRLNKPEAGCQNNPIVVSFHLQKSTKGFVENSADNIQYIKDNLHPPCQRGLKQLQVLRWESLKFLQSMSIHHYLFQTQQKILIRRVGCSAVGTLKILMGTHYNNDKRVCHHFETLSFLQHNFARWHSNFLIF